MIDARTQEPRPFFEYFEFAASGALQQVASVPLVHPGVTQAPGTPLPATIPIQEIAAVRINMQSTNGRPGNRKMTRDLTRLVHLPNVGRYRAQTCGADPVLGGGLSPAVEAGPPLAVRLTWPPSPDEMDGERDVTMYVIWRRETTDPEWRTPLVNIAPSGDNPYTFVDASVESGRSYMYGLQAQDCSPALSAMSIVGPVAVP
jgi:hypothetical protein